jgi:hypothetical protein
MSPAGTSSGCRARGRSPPEPTRSANVETGSNYIAVHAEGAAAFMASGFAKHIGHLGVGVGTACIRHKSSARRPDFTVHGLC